MTRPIRGDRPGCPGLVLHPEERVAVDGLERHRATAIGQAALVGSQDLRQAGRLLEIRRIGGHHQEFPGPDPGAFGKGELHLTRQPCPGEVFRDRPGVVELDELKIPLPLPLTGMVHELGKHETGRSHEGPEGFAIADPGADGRADHRPQITEPGGGRGLLILARHRRTKEQRRRHTRDRDRPKLGPDPSIHAGEPGEDAARTPQPKPGLRIADRKPSGNRGLGRSRRHRGP